MMALPPQFAKKGAPAPAKKVAPPKKPADKGAKSPVGNIFALQGDAPQMAGGQKMPFGRC